jgi:hypothetical protein
VIVGISTYAAARIRRFAQGHGARCLATLPIRMAPGRTTDRCCWRVIARRREAILTNLGGLCARRCGLVVPGVYCRCVRTIVRMNLGSGHPTWGSRPTEIFDRLDSQSTGLAAPMRVWRASEGAFAACPPHGLQPRPGCGTGHSRAWSQPGAPPPSSDPRSVDDAPGPVGSGGEAPRPTGSTKPHLPGGHRHRRIVRRAIPSGTGWAWLREEGTNGIDPDALRG